MIHGFLLLCMIAHAQDGISGTVLEFQERSGGQVLVGVAGTDATDLAERLERDLGAAKARVLVLQGLDPAVALSEALLREGLVCGILVNDQDGRVSVRAVGDCGAVSAAPVVPPVEPVAVLPEPAVLPSAEPVAPSTEAPPPKPVKPPHVPSYHPPENPTLVIDFFHIRMGWPGASWSTGALVDRRLNDAWSVSGSGILNVGVLMALEGSVGFRYHPVSFEKGRFWDVGGGVSYSTTLDLYSDSSFPSFMLSTHALLGWRFLTAQHKDVALFRVMDLGFGIHCEGGFSNDPWGSFGLMIQWDGGFIQ